MAVGADGGAGAVGCPVVHGDHHPAGGGDLDDRGAEPVRHGHRAVGQLRRHGVAVAAEGDQGLRGHLPGHGQHRGGGPGRQRRQRFGGGESTDAAAGPVRLDDPQAGVGLGGAERVQPGLGLPEGGLVGQGPPPALRRGVVGLLHHSLAVTAPRRADRDLDPVVLGDLGERGRDPPRRRVTHGGHPVEPPLPGQAAQGRR